MRKAALVATGVLIVLSAVGLFDSRDFFGLTKEQLAASVVLLLVLIAGILRLLRRKH